MSSRPASILRALTVAVVLLTTPGVSDLVETVIHDAVAGTDAHTHHGPCSDPSGAPCTPDCARGLFHTCHCASPAYGPSPDASALAAPAVSALPRPRAAASDTLLRGHRRPLFKPPSA